MNKRTEKVGLSGADLPSFPLSPHPGKGASLRLQHEHSQVRLHIRAALWQMFERCTGSHDRFTDRSGIFGPPPPVALPGRELSKVLDDLMLVAADDKFLTTENSKSTEVELCADLRHARNVVVGCDRSSTACPAVDSDGTERGRFQAQNVRSRDAWRRCQELAPDGLEVDALQGHEARPVQRNRNGLRVDPVSRRTMVARSAAALMIPSLSGFAYAENGVSDNVIRIGQSAVFSGPAKDFGADYLAGLQICFGRINRSGGINGRKIELISYDDMYEPAKTAVNTAKLIDEDKVFALIGYVATGNLAAAMPLADKAGVPMFAPLVGTTSFRTNFNRNLFHVRAGYDLELRKIISHLSTIGITNIAVVFQDSAFGKSNLATCEQLAAEYKVQVVKAVPMAIAATDAKEISAALKGAKPGAVVMIMAGRMVEVFIRDYRAGGAAAPLYTLSVGITDAPGSAERLQGKLEGLVTASIVPPPHSRSVQIVADYQRDRAEAGEKIDSYTALEGYIVARVFAEGLRRAGRALTREAFVAGMESIGNARFGEFPVTYGPRNHNGSNFVDLEMYKRDGRLQR